MNPIQRVKTSITGTKLTDAVTFSKMDNDTFRKMCRDSNYFNNKYIQSLCNDEYILMERLKINFGPEILKFKPNNVSIKDYHDLIVYYPKLFIKMASMFGYTKLFDELLKDDVIKSIIYDPKEKIPSWAMYSGNMQMVRYFYNTLGMKSPTLFNIYEDNADDVLYKFVNTRNVDYRNSIYKPMIDELIYIIKSWITDNKYPPYIINILRHYSLAPIYMNTIINDIINDIQDKEKITQKNQINDEINFDAPMSGDSKYIMISFLPQKDFESYLKATKMKKNEKMFYYRIKAIGEATLNFKPKDMTFEEYYYLIYDQQDVFWNIVMIKGNSNIVEELFNLHSKDDYISYGFQNDILFAYLFMNIDILQYLYDIDYDFNSIDDENFPYNYAEYLDNDADTIFHSNQKNKFKYIIQTKNNILYDQSGKNRRTIKQQIMDFFDNSREILHKFNIDTNMENLYAKK